MVQCVKKNKLNGLESIQICQKCFLFSNSEYPNGCGEPVIEANGLTKEKNNIKKNNNHKLPPLYTTPVPCGEREREQEREGGM